MRIFKYLLIIFLSWGVKDVLSAGAACHDGRDVDSAVNHIRLVHMTRGFSPKFFKSGVLETQPFIYNEEGDKVYVMRAHLPLKRTTCHFSIAKPVEAHSLGSWDDCPYAITVPLGDIKERCLGGARDDIYFLSPLHLPLSTVLYVPENELEKFVNLPFKIHPYPLEIGIREVLSRELTYPFGDAEAREIFPRGEVFYHYTALGFIEATISRLNASGLDEFIKTNKIPSYTFEFNKIQFLMELRDGLLKTLKISDQIEPEVEAWKRGLTTHDAFFHLLSKEGLSIASENSFWERLEPVNFSEESWIHNFIKSWEGYKSGKGLADTRGSLQEGLAGLDFNILKEFFGELITTGGFAINLLDALSDSAEYQRVRLKEPRIQEFIEGAILIERVLTETLSDEKIKFQVPNVDLRKINQSLLRGYVLENLKLNFSDEEDLKSKLLENKQFAVVFQHFFQEVFTKIALDKVLKEENS